MFTIASMTSPTLVIGEPRFADVELARIERGHGPRAAWEAGLSGVQSVDDACRLVASTRGHFAVAMPVGERGWLLAIDRLAVQTLCWRLDDGVLRVAQRADTLAAIGEGADTSSSGLRPQALQDYLVQHAIASPNTVFSGVQRLMPAHLVWFDGQQAHLRRYWEPAFVEIAKPSFDALKAEFLKHVQESVGRALDTSQPACFLSGGTDSSTVAGMIGRVAGRPASTWSIGFEAAGYDEMAYARIAAKAYGTDHHEYYVTPQDLLDGIPLYAASIDQPFGNSSALPAYWCARKAREGGVTRLLAGDGGDELFGGNARYAKQRVFQVFEKLPQPARSALEVVFAKRSPLAHVPLLKKGVSYVEQARVPMPARDNFYNLFLRLGGDEILEPTFRRDVDELTATRHRNAVWGETHASASELNKNLAYDWRFTLAESDLPKVRSACELAGVEVTYPFLDQALLDFSLTLPTRYKLKGMKLRWFFKEALRGFLPDEIITKSKHGFGLPFGVWCVQHPALGAFARQSVEALVARRVVRAAYVKHLFDHQLPAYPGFHGEMVWILMMLEQWLSRHAPHWQSGDPQPRPPVPPTPAQPIMEAPAR